MKYKGIIFDLDGVICSTDQLHYKAWKKVADKICVPFDEHENERLRGVSREDSLDILLEKASRYYSQDEKEDLLDLKNRYYKRFLETITSDLLSHDVKTTLDLLKEQNLKLAIGSSSKNARFILSRLGLDDYFDVVSDGTNISKSKPDPEVFLKAALMLHLESKDCLVVEDAISGVNAALNGHFDCAGMNVANSHPQVTYRLHKFSDILNYIG